MATIVRLFDTREQARRAIDDLRAAGMPLEDLSVVMRDRADSARLASDVGADDATAAGAIGGGLLGGVAGLLAGAGALVIPGIGPIIAAGPILAAITGGAVGAVTGGLIGGLIDLGIPEEEARDYQAGVERGGVLLTASVPDARRSEAIAVLDRVGSRDLAHHRDRWRSNPAHRYDTEPPPAGDAVAGGLLTGGVTGGIIGGVVGGPPGALIGVAIGSATGAGVGAAAGYDEVEPEFRADWERSPYRDRLSWDRAASAYRHGWDSHDTFPSAEKTWDEIRAEVRRDWADEPTWAEYEPLVRRGWERRRAEAVVGR